MSSPPTPAGPPPEITHLVRERMEARIRRDWPRADALKAQIEEAGWRVVDHGNRTSVGPAAPPAVEVDGELRYGSASPVPSRLDAPATNPWTVVVVASEAPERLSRLLGALRANAPAGTQVVAVANDPSDSQIAALRPEAPDRAPIGGIVPEVLRTSTHLGYAAALNIGLRRATGELVLVADTTAWPTGDAITPLAAALQDPAVAAAGGFGLVPAEAGPLRPNALLRSGSAAAADVPATPVVTALEGGWLACRRSDYRDLGPLDEHFVTPAWLDVWWTLRLRAGAEPEGAEYVASEDDLEATAGPAASVPVEVAEPGVHLPAPRRAVRVELPLEREGVAWPPDRSRLNRRNMYRVLDRYGWRDDLS
ncbi:MAG TPA: glycosyltransferase [Candidatus Limnocylindrales bacterium]